MNVQTAKTRIKQEWNDNPIAVIGIGASATIAAAKLIDAVSAAQGRRAYAKQVRYTTSRRNRRY